MKKLINQNKVILTTKYINYTNYEVSLKKYPLSSQTEGL